jgi:hypothetical protein
VKELYNEFREFISLEDALNFGMKYFSEWLKDFQVEGKFRRIYKLGDIEYLTIKEEKGQEYAEQIKRECLVYEAFSYYCGGNYGLAINELCRYGHSNYQFKKEILESLIQVIDNEINKYEIRENIIAYRTFCYKDFLRAQKTNRINIDDIITDQGFMGVGLVKEKLLEEHDYDTVMKVYIPVGSQAIYIDLISNRLNEQELLFKKGTRLKVLSNKKSIFGNKRNMICVIL